MPKPSMGERLVGEIVRWRDEVQRWRNAEAEWRACGDTARAREAHVSAEAIERCAARVQAIVLWGGGPEVGGVPGGAAHAARPQPR